MGLMTVVEQKLEGEFRYVNSRLITNRLHIYNASSITFLQSFCHSQWLYNSFKLIWVLNVFFCDIYYFLFVQLFL